MRNVRLGEPAKPLLAPMFADQGKAVRIVPIEFRRMLPSTCLIGIEAMKVACGLLRMKIMKKLDFSYLTPGLPICRTMNSLTASQSQIWVQARAENGVRALFQIGSTLSIISY
jgi:hypothetical protein